MSIMIDKNSVIPYYSQLADILRDLILSGAYEQMPMLPSEREFCELYQVSRSTVRQAMQILREEGYIKRERGIGTKVKRSDKLEHDLRGYHNFDIQMRASGHEGTVKILRDSILQGPGRVQRLLGILEEVGIFKIVRLRLVDNEPIFLEKIYMPLDLFPSLKAEDFTGTDIFQRILTQRYGTRLGDVKLFLEPIILDDEEREMLGVHRNPSPALLLERLSYDSAGKAVALTKRLFRGDRCRHMLMIRV